MAYYAKINGGTFDAGLLRRAEQLQAGQGDGRISKADAQQLSDAVYDKFPAAPASQPARTQIESNTVRKIRRDANFTAAGRDAFEAANRSHGAQQGWETRRANTQDKARAAGVASQLAVFAQQQS